MMRRPIREICECCAKTINIGQSITECQKCDLAIHSRCFKASSFKFVNNRPHCHNCCDDVKLIYNPFENLNGLRNHSANDDGHSDKHYDTDLNDVFDEFTVASNILNTCRVIIRIKGASRKAPLLLKGYECVSSVD